MRALRFGNKSYRGLPEDGIVRGVVACRTGGQRILVNDRLVASPEQHQLHAARQNTTACNMNYRGISGQVLGILGYGGYREIICPVKGVALLPVILAQVTCTHCVEALRKK